jgi:hypothetical protein
MSYELMSDDRLQDELMKIQGVLNERIAKRAATEAEREEERDRLERQARGRILAPIVDEYKKLTALCKNEIEMTSEFEIPVELALTLSTNPDDDPDDNYFDDLEITVTVKKNGKIPTDCIDSMEQALADTFNDFDADDLLKLCGGGKIHEINEMKRNIQKSLDQTDYSWDDLTEAVEDSE